MPMKLLLYLALVLMVGYLAPATCAGASADKVCDEVWTKFQTGQPQELIVVLDDAEIEAEAAALRRSRGLVFDDAELQRFKADRYASMKTAVLATVAAGKVETIREFGSLPLMFLRFSSADALSSLLAHPRVLRVHFNEEEQLMPPEPKR